ncbi:exportin-T-like [Periplaneta americana]|uniref:exportin-T-like n=1 Tax=Periplaneta americana TaxID=6978 RepID=UPI0037E80F20
MDSEMFQCIEAQGDPEAHARSLSYFEDLKNSEKGYLVCMDLLTNESQCDDSVKFFCFKVIEHYIEGKYSKLRSDHEFHVVKDFLGRYIEVRYNNPTCKTDCIAIRNKAAQIYAMAFVREYARCWSSFLSDILKTLAMGSRAVDHYLRVLKAINLEIGEQGFHRQQDDLTRNKAIKDKMREADTRILADSWHFILHQYAGQEPSIVALCLEVISDYTEWIDVGLVTYGSFLQSILKECSNIHTRLQAINFFYCLLKKGLDPIEKFKLIENLVPLLSMAGVFNILEDDEETFNINVGMLVNKIGANLIQIETDICKKQPTIDRHTVEMALENKLPPALYVLKSENCNVSATVIEFIKLFLRRLKNKTCTREIATSNLGEVLKIIFKKYKMKDTYNFDKEGELEINFNDYRQQLGTLLNAIASVDKEFLIHYVREYITRTLMNENWNVGSFSVPECAIKLLRDLGDSISISSSDNHFVNTGTNPEYTVFRDMMHILVTCRVDAHPHPAVAVQFFETVVRYVNFFTLEPEKIPPVLAAFLDHRGMKCRNPKLKNRCAALFLKFIKPLKTYIADYASEVLKRLQELNAFSILETSQQQNCCVFSQANRIILYESSAILIAHGYFEPHQKRVLITDLLSSALNSFSNIVELIATEPDAEIRSSLAQRLCHAFTVTSSTAKAFKDLAMLRQCDCVQIYMDALDVFMCSLRIADSEPSVSNAMRQLIHRLVVCLEEELVPYLPIVTRGLRTARSIECVVENTFLLIQILNKYGKKLTTLLQQDFSDIVNCIFNAYRESASDDGYDKRVLQRCYLVFVMALINNEMLIDVLSVQDLWCVKQMVSTIVIGGTDYPDPSVQRQCFLILTKIVEGWTTTEPNKSKSFYDCLYEQIIPACFSAPLKPTFLLGDPNYQKILMQCITLLEAIYTKLGDELMKYLRARIFPNLNLCHKKIEEFIDLLVKNERMFNVYMKDFIIERRTALYENEVHS